MDHVDTGTKWIPIWSQFSTSSGGTSSMVTTATMSSKKALFIAAKFSGVCLLFAVVAFLLTNFIQLSRWYAHCQLNSMWPPNSASCVQSRDIRIPLAAATTTEAVTTSSVFPDLAQVQLYLFITVLPKEKSATFFVRKLSYLLVRWISCLLLHTLQVRQLDQTNWLLTDFPQLPGKVGTGRTCAMLAGILGDVGTNFWRIPTETCK